MDKRYCDINEISQFLQVKVSTLYSWVYKGTIPYYKLNGLLRFDLAEIEQWVGTSRHTIETLAMPIKSRNLPDIDTIVKKAIEGGKGKAYNPAYGKPNRSQGLGKDI